jgi:hypothetical protein
MSMTIIRILWMKRHHQLKRTQIRIWITNHENRIKDGSSSSKIYENELIRKSFCFPKYFGFMDENDIRIEREVIIPGYKIDFAQY